MPEKDNLALQKTSPLGRLKCQAKEDLEDGVGDKVEVETRVEEEAEVE